MSDDRQLTSAEIRAKADAISAAILGKRKPEQTATPDPAVPIEPEFVTPEWESWWLPEPVGRWVDACSSAYGVPKAMAIAAAMCAACTVLQGKVSVQVKPGWVEPLSLYWLVFSPTGSRKSALLKAATAPVRALQDSRRRELEPEIRSKSNEKARLEQQIARMRRAVKAHSYTEGAQEHLQQLRELEHQHAETVVPMPPRWLYDDINPTMVPRKLGYSQDAEGIARIAILDAEGTFLANLLGRHSGHVNVDPLLKGYMGEPIDMVRAVHGSKDTQDIHLDAAHLTLLLLVQPHYLDEIRAKPELSSNGLLGRCLMSHLRHSSEPMPWSAPEVPQDVQQGYADWIATLEGIAPGTVWQMPASVHPELRELHDRLEQDRLADAGAVGFTVRSLGRICRVIAITELADTMTRGDVGILSQLSHCRSAPGGAVRTRVISKLTYLTNLLYTQPLSSQRLVEPPLHPLATLCGRALRWLRQYPAATVEFRTLCNRLHLKKDVGLALCDSLVESGHLEQQAATVRANKTLTVRYKILNTEPVPREPPPKAFLAALPTGAELEQSSPPAPEEYLGAEDFEGNQDT